MNNPKYKTVMPNAMFALAARLKEAVWYYLWCIDRTTEEWTYDEDGPRVFGAVLGHMPCGDSFVANDLPSISKWTIKRWREACIKEGVIRAKRTPIGYSIQVINSEKFSADKRKHGIKWGRSNTREVANLPTQSEQICQLTDKSELPIQQLRVGESPIQSQSELANQQLYIERTVFKKENKEKTGSGKPDSLNENLKDAGKEKQPPKPPSLPVETQSATALVDNIVSLALELTEGRAVFYPKHIDSLTDQILKHRPNPEICLFAARQTIGEMAGDTFKEGQCGSQLSATLIALTRYREKERARQIELDAECEAAKARGEAEFRKEHEEWLAAEKEAEEQSAAWLASLKQKTVAVRA